MTGRAWRTINGSRLVRVLSRFARCAHSIVAVVARLAWNQRAVSVEIRSENGDDLAVEAGHPGRGWARELLPSCAIVFLVVALCTHVVGLVFPWGTWLTRCSLPCRSLTRRARGTVVGLHFTVSARRARHFAKIPRAVRTSGTCSHVAIVVIHAVGFSQKNFPLCAAVRKFMKSVKKYARKQVGVAV